MLRIEKNNTIQIYHKEGLFTLAFWQALAIALTLHLMVFIFVEIKPLKICETKAILSTAYIETNLHYDEKGPYTSLLKETALPHINPILPLSEPNHYFFPPITIISTPDELDPILTALPRSDIPEVYVNTFGPLASRQLVPFSLDEKILNMLEGKQQLHRFEIQVDNRTGTVFEIVSRSANDTKIENEIINLMLKKMRFNIIGNELFSKGEVEVSIIYQIKSS